MIRRKRTTTSTKYYTVTK